MRILRIRTDQAVPGMIVANDIYTTNNQLIITRGTELNEKVITKLRFYNIYGLSVFEKVMEEGTSNSYIEEIRNTQEFKKFNRTYVDTVTNVQKSFHSIIGENEEVNIDQLLEETNRLLHEGRNGAHVLEMLHGIRNYDDMTYVHSMNVSLICGIFAGWLKLSKEDTKNLTLAGLLHDIGKMLIPKEILNKPGKLTENEYDIMKAHTIKGYQVLKDLPVELSVKYAALMHHERQDGSGYPNGFVADQIDEFSKIIAIADVYDAMTSNRIYRNAFCPFDVVENFEQEGFLKYDPKYLMTFLERIAESYLHNRVRLSDGRLGEVIMINKLSLSRPVVRVGETFVYLSKEFNLCIEAIV